MATLSHEYGHMQGTESSSPSLVQGLGLAAAALVVTYAAYAERHALSR